MASARNILRRQKSNIRYTLKRKRCSCRLIRESRVCIRHRPKINPVENRIIMDKAVSKQNMLKALKRAEKNKGAPGIDDLQ